MATTTSTSVLCHNCDVPTDKDDGYECEVCNLYHCDDCARGTQDNKWPLNIFGSIGCSKCRGAPRCWEHECLECLYCIKCEGHHYSTPNNEHNYDNCDCGDDLRCGCFDGPRDLISFQLGVQKPTPSNLCPFINTFIDKYPSYSERILMGGACRFALKESQKTIKLMSLLDSGLDYWKRKFHGFHSKEMKEIVFLLLLIYRRSCTRTNTLQLPYIPEEIWLLFPQCLRSADVSIHPSITF